MSIYTKSRYVNVGIIVLILSLIAASMMSVAVAQDQSTTSTTSATSNTTKLSIVPQYGNIRVQPGESRETSVLVTNNDNVPVKVNPNVTIPPYGNNMGDPSWIKITNNAATNSNTIGNEVEIPSGKSVRFTISVSVPVGTSLGNYGVQIAFTNETSYSQPAPYPESTNNYAHTFYLSIEVWKPSNLQISSPYISDRLESGKSYDYEVTVRNIGTYDIGINPTIMNDIYYGPGVYAPILPEGSITITAPKSISAGSVEKIKIHADIPKNVSGFYNGYIDLLPDDPLTREGDARIGFGIDIWQQPTNAFVKNFSLDRVAPIKIEIFSFLNRDPSLKTPIAEPSFVTNIIGPAGEISPNITKTVTRGNINIVGRPTANLVTGGSTYNFVNTPSYQEIGNQNVITYETGGSPGEWILKILSSNTPSFDYSITVGEDK